MTKQGKISGEKIEHKIGEVVTTDKFEISAEQYEKEGFKIRVDADKDYDLETK